VGEVHRAVCVGRNDEKTRQMVHKPACVWAQHECYPFKWRRTLFSYLDAFYVRPSLWRSGANVI